MPDQDSAVNYWQLRSSELAEECLTLLDDRSLTSAPELHRELNMISRSWSETFEMPTESFEEQARRAARIGALRKRTIELLVRIEKRPGA